MKTNPPFIGLLSSEDDTITVVFANKKKVEEMYKESNTPLIKSVKLEDRYLKLYFHTGDSVQMVFEKRTQQEKLKYFFAVLFTHYKADPKKPVSQEEIRSELLKFKSQFDIETISQHGYVSDQIGNIRKKIKSSGLTDFISIIYIKRSLSPTGIAGYVIKIRQSYNVELSK